MAEAASEQLKAVPPMVRCVVCDYINRGWAEGSLRFDLYYGERMYGCGRESNQQYVDWLGFFGSPGDDANVPTAVTKDILREALEQHGIPRKKSVTRSAMLESGRSIPGFLSTLISRHCPEQRVLLPEWKESVNCWTHRVLCAEVLSELVISFMARSAINERCLNKDFFNGVKKEPLFKTISHIANGVDRFMAGQTDVDEYPAWEFRQFYERETLDKDWLARWRVAAKEVGDDDALRVLEKTGQMIALKSSGIWQALGNGVGGYDDALGNPWPPFALDSGYDVDGIPRNECEELGLLKRGEEAKCSLAAKELA